MKTKTSVLIAAVVEKKGAKKEKQSITNTGKGKRKVQALLDSNMPEEYSNHVYRDHFLSVSFRTRSFCLAD